MGSQLLFASPRLLSASFSNSLSPAQSLAVVEIFINATLACICHTRELIPWDSPSLRTRYIDDLYSDFWKDDVNRYSAFCNPEDSITSSKSQEFKILKRGENKRADDILDLLETGVFSAVNGGFLEAVRLFITQGGTDCHSRDVLESYNLDFNYKHDKINSNGLHTVSFDSTHVFATENAIKSFKRAMKSLLTSLQGLPATGRKRSLGVAMLYNNRCPPNYEIPGFLTEDVSLAAKEQTGWHKVFLQETLEVGELEVGPYRVTVGASNVRSIGVPTSSRVRDLETRMQLQSWQKSSSQQNNILLSTIQRDLDFHSASQESRKRQISIWPVEETPHKKKARAGEAGYREAAPSMNPVPPTYSRVKPSTTRKARSREALITPDRSSPSMAFPMDGGLEEAERVASGDAQWEAFA